MADPPAGAPEAPPTNPERPVADFEPRITPRKRRQPRQGDEFVSTPRSNPEFAGESTGRVTTKEVWKLIDTLKDIIHHQTTLIESTQSELQEVKHNQNVLQEQNEELQEEVRALRTQLETLPSAPSARSWAAVAASDSNPLPQRIHQQPDKDQNCVRISTQRSFVDPRDNDNSDGNTFGRYLSTDSANNHIRTALLNTPSTQDAQVAAIGTTKTGYVIRKSNRLILRPAP